jgi:hypothetical protein
MSKVAPRHLERKAFVYVRQSSPGQVLTHPESARCRRSSETAVFMLAREGLVIIRAEGASDVMV